MAFKNWQTSAENAPVQAGTDLSGHQYKAVQINATGIFPAVTDAASGPVWVLDNSPSSGGACTLMGPPNVAQAVAGGTIAIGDYVTITGSAAFSALAVTSTGAHFEDGVIQIVGAAFESVASGGHFALRLL